ncbi:hypothetical protein CP8484711_1162A, partial [Chlamydia psittaci 84-8471/1]
MVITTTMLVIQERLYLSKNKENALTSPETKLISSFGITMAIERDP